VRNGHTHAVTPRNSSVQLSAAARKLLRAAACTLPTHTKHLLAPANLPANQNIHTHRIYKSSRKLYNEADAQGMRVYHDELLAGDVRLVMLVPSWFPKAHVAFDFDRVAGDRLSVVLVLRGTMQVRALPACMAAAVG
jgi:hypothetical protein